MDAGDLGAALRDWAHHYGDRPAVLDANAALSFAELDAAADAWANRLGDAGVGSGAHVGLFADNSPAWMAAAFGVWRAGATLVPVSTFVTARELTEILPSSEVETLIVQPHRQTHDYLALVEVLPAAARPRRIIPLDTQPTNVGRDTSFAHHRAIAPESIACVLYTSGTSGRPKGVRLSHRAILATVGPTGARTGLTSEDSLLSTLPLFWVAGLIIRALPTLATGCSLIVVDRFTAGAVLALLRRHRPTALHLRPPQIGALLAHPDFTPAMLAGIRRGGGRAEWFAPHLDPETTRLITGYGMTETAGYVTALDWRDPASVRAAQIGRPLPGVDLRIVDGAGQPCTAGVEGEIRVRGPGLFSGYQQQPPGHGLDAEGFFCTGDRGHIDAGGVFHFSGRSKDLLRVKGINVSPMEVERVLEAHPGVDAAYVVGLPTDDLEQTIVALIVARGAAVAEVELRAYAAAQLSHYKRPIHYVPVRREDIPLSGTSKPQRAALAVLAADRLGLAARPPVGERPVN